MELQGAQKRGRRMSSLAGEAASTPESMTSVGVEEKMRASKVAARWAREAAAELCAGGNGRANGGRARQRR